MDDAFAHLVVTHYESLRRAALVLAPSPHDAEDLVQVAFVKAHRSRELVQAAADPAAYLHRILINASRSRSRRLWHRERPTAPEDLPQAAAEASDQVLRKITIVAALRTLPTAQREAVVARHLLGLSEADAAHALGCPAGTVKSRTARGLAALRPLLEDLDAREGTTLD